MSDKPVYHGRDHRPGGADPIVEMIAFDIDNVGDWLDIETSTDSPHGFGVRLLDTSADGILLHGDAGVALTGGTATAIFAGPVDAEIDSTGNIVLQATGALDTISGGVSIQATTGTILIEADTVNNQTIAFSISPTGGSFQIANLPTSAPALAGSVWNSSGTLKIV